MRLVTALLVLGLVAAAPTAQSGKKVFISADMEGISGISASDQLSASGAEYNRSRKMMADDVNAAIRGARRGGATDIVVNDSHGSMRNLRLEDLDGQVRLISHSFKRSGMMEGLDESFDAAIFMECSSPERAGGLIDLSDKTGFEFGSGNSSLFWADKLRRPRRKPPSPPPRPMDRMNRPSIFPISWRQRVQLSSPAGPPTTSYIP